MKTYLSLGLFYILITTFSHADDSEKTPLIPKKEVTNKTNAALWEKLRKENPNAIGAIAESSKFLAKAITNLIHIPKYSFTQILEVGAGTGVFTREIAPKLGSNAHLTVVELIKDLCNLLEDEFGNNKSITIYCGDILDWKPGSNTYDYIVSGLPFNSFSAQLVKDITDQFISLSKPNGYVSFFEYLLLPKIRPLIMNKQEKIEYDTTRAAILNFVNKYSFDKTEVHRNIPPAVVYHLKITK